MLLAGLSPGGRRHRFVAARPERAPRRGLIVEQPKVDRERARLGPTLSRHVAHASQHRQRHAHAGGGWPAGAPVALDNAFAVGAARVGAARESGGREIQLAKGGDQTGPRLHHELERSRRRPPGAEERLVAPSRPGWLRRQLLALPGSERPESAVGRLLGGEQHMRDHKWAAVVRAHGGGEDVAVPIEEAHVEDGLAPRRRKGVGSAIRHHPMVRHPAVGSARDLVLWSVEEPRAANHAILRVQRHHGSAREVVGATTRLWQVEWAACVALVQGVDTHRRHPCAPRAEPRRRAHERWVELAELVQHHGPWPTNGTKLQQERVLSVRLEHLRPQPAQKLPVARKDVAGAEHALGHGSRPQPRYGGAHPHPCCLA